MIRYFGIILIAVILGSCGASSETPMGNVTISGKLTNRNADSITLKDANSQQMPLISKSPIDQDGNFSITFNVQEQGFYRLETTEQNFAILIVKPGDKIQMDGDAAKLGYSYSVKGSDETVLFKEINDFSTDLALQKNLIGQKKDSIIKLYQYLLSQKPNDKRYSDSLDKAMEPAFNVVDQQLTPLIQSGVSHAKDFIDKHPGSFSNLVAIGLLNQEADFEYFMKVYTDYKKTFPESKSLGGFYAWMNDKLKMAPGSPAPDFTVTDPDGKPLALSSFKGKILLVDFWASWCGPCRKENPNVVRLYKEYKDKGLEIFGVSLDEDKAKWLDAIAKDGLTWKHGSELRGWNSTFCPLYGIQGIPFTVLLDREGNIIATNLRGPSLEMKLAQLFSQP